MGAAVHPKLEGIDLIASYLLGVIYDDESLTLEMEFCVTKAHPGYVAPGKGEDGCFRKGFIRFADFEDLRLRKAKIADDEDIDLSVIYSVSIEGDYAFIESGWGEIELTARSIRIAVD